MKKRQTIPPGLLSPGLTHCLDLTSLPSGHTHTLFMHVESGIASKQSVSDVHGSPSSAKVVILIQNCVMDSSLTV